ncbi:ABC [Ectocarpus sp. CCAP 1310/34]|nr:ABC [Ectocarpus sp. CCAP 1310/34]
MDLLRRLASEMGVIIITSAHQLSSRVFNSFDQVILITMGQTAYFGPAVGGLDHFASLGHKPDGLVNPADYLLEITNSDFSDAKAVQRLADAWKNSSACKTLHSRLHSPLPPSLEAKPEAEWMSNLRQLRALIARAAMSSVRDPAAYALRYYKVENTQEDILNRNGQYGVAMFCIANAMVQAPFVLLIAVCCCTPVYWTTDMNDDPTRCSGD